MFNFFLNLFRGGGSFEKKEQDKKENKKPDKDSLKKQAKQNMNSEEIIYNLFMYTKSPMYENDIESFLEANCITFEDVEENKHQHFTIHQEFIELVERKLCEAMEFLSIDKD